LVDDSDEVDRKAADRIIGIGGNIKSTSVSILISRRSVESSGHWESHEATLGVGGTLTSGEECQEQNKRLFVMDD
jgi:hypothetical protein